MKKEKNLKMPKRTKIKEQCQEFMSDPAVTSIWKGQDRIYPVLSTFPQNCGVQVNEYDIN